MTELVPVEGKTREASLEIVAEQGDKGDKP